MCDLNPVSEPFLAFLTHVTRVGQHVVCWAQTSAQDCLRLEKTLTNERRDLMNNWFQRNSKEIQIIFGKYYVFCEPKNLQFYRVRAEEEPSGAFGSVRVTFIDFGYEEVVNTCQLMVFKGLFEHVVSDLAQSFDLKGLKVTSNEMFREREHVVLKPFLKHVFLMRRGKGNEAEVYDLKTGSRSLREVLIREGICEEFKEFLEIEYKIEEKSEKGVIDDVIDGKRETFLMEILEKKKFSKVFLIQKNLKTVFIQLKEKNEEILKISRELEEIIENNRKKHLINGKNCFIGEKVVAKYENVWFRAKVIQRNEEMKKIKVFFIDFGNEDIYDFEECLLLSQFGPKFLELEEQALECRVINEEDLDFELISEDLELFCHFLSLNEKKVFEIKLCFEEFKSQESDPLIGQHNTTSDHLIGSQHLVTITHALSSKQVFLQLKELFVNFLEPLEKKMSEKYQDKPQIDCACAKKLEFLAVFDELSQKWKRARILSVDTCSSLCHVLFVDYGNEARVELSACRALESRDLNEIEFLGKKCFLLNKNLNYYSLKRFESKETEIWAQFVDRKSGNEEFEVILSQIT